eukprot:TRINITY_DN27638_c0_g1_i1.p1 TRINITY_DN27638_c0_g1~~TRINITY_DN27638_c0_g1_i1.p1  ORF type:complete len:2450 (+),score=550.79 TRINITY_DN27638_c0_g1_i1:50-7399(+)
MASSSALADEVDGSGGYVTELLEDAVLTVRDASVVDAPQVTIDQEYDDHDDWDSEEEEHRYYADGPFSGDAEALASENWDELHWQLAHLLQDGDVLLTLGHLYAGLRRLSGPKPDGSGLKVVSEDTLSEALSKQEVGKAPLRISDSMVWKLGRTWRAGDRSKLFTLDPRAEDVDPSVLKLLMKTRSDLARLLRTVFHLILAKHRSLPEAFGTFDRESSREVTLEEFEHGMVQLVAESENVPSCLTQPNWARKLFLVLGGGGGSMTLHDFSIRLCGIGRGAVRALRDKLLLKYHGITRAWEALATPEAGSKESSVGEEDFVAEYLALLRGKNAITSSANTGFVVDPEEEKQEALLTWQARALFHMMDAGSGNANGRLDLSELQLMMADVGPPCVLEEFRTKLLLQHGNWQAAMQAVQRSGKTAKTLYGQLVRAAGTLDIRISDLQCIFERVCPSAVRGEVSPQDFMQQLQSHGKGFSIAEMSIRLWLGKPEGMSVEAVLQRNPIDASRSLRLDEFSAELFGLGPLASKMKSEQRKILPALPRLTEAEVSQLYHALRLQHHGKVTLKNLQRSALTSNLSDVLAMDKTAYSPGETAYIRYFIPRDKEKQLLEKPFIAMTSTEMRWVAGGGGGWMLRGKPITDVDSVVAQLPNRREGVVCINIPPSEALFERQEFRLFASPNGTRIGPQVGGGVSFEVLPPRAGQPICDEVTHQSARLTWTPPELVSGKIQISHYTVRVVPLEAAYELSTKNSGAFRSQTTWDHERQALRQGCSFRLTGLQPGITYRTAVVPHYIGKDSLYEGPPSNMSEDMVVPACIPPGPPGAPEVVQGDRQELYVEVSLPEQDGGDRISSIVVYRSISIEPQPPRLLRSSSKYFHATKSIKKKEKAGLIQLDAVYVQISHREHKARVLLRDMPCDGQVWQFCCAGLNSAGEGPLSDSSGPWQAPKPLAPPCRPGTPQVLNVNAATVELCWDPPETDGNLDVQYYRVSAFPFEGQRHLVATSWHAQEVDTADGKVRCLLRWKQDIGSYGCFTFAVEAINGLGKSPSSDRSSPVQLREDAGLRLLAILGMNDSDGGVKQSVGRLALGQAVEHRGGLDNFLQILTDEGLGPPVPESEDEEENADKNDEGDEGQGPDDQLHAKEEKDDSRRMVRNEQRRREAVRAATSALTAWLEPAGGAAGFLLAAEGLEARNFPAWLNVLRDAGGSSEIDTCAWQELAAAAVACGGPADVAMMLHCCTFGEKGAAALTGVLAGGCPREEVKKSLAKLQSFVQRANGSLGEFLDMLDGFELKDVKDQVRLLNELGISGSASSKGKLEATLRKVKQAGGPDAFLKATEGLDMSALGDCKELAFAAGIGQAAPAGGTEHSTGLAPGASSEGQRNSSSNLTGFQQQTVAEVSATAPELLRAAQAAGGLSESLALLRQAKRAGGASKLLEALAFTASQVPGAEKLFGSLADEAPSHGPGEASDHSSKNSLSRKSTAPASGVERAFCPLCGRLDQRAAREVLGREKARPSLLPVQASAAGAPSTDTSTVPRTTSEAWSPRTSASAAAAVAVHRITQAAYRRACLPTGEGAALPHTGHMMPPPGDGDGYIFAGVVAAAAATAEQDLPELSDPCNAVRDVLLEGKLGSSAALEGVEAKVEVDAIGRSVSSQAEAVTAGPPSRRRSGESIFSESASVAEEEFATSVLDIFLEGSPASHASPAKKSRSSLQARAGEMSALSSQVPGSSSTGPPSAQRIQSVPENGVLQQPESLQGTQGVDVHIDEKPGFRVRKALPKKLSKQDEAFLKDFSDPELKEALHRAKEEASGDGLLEVLRAIEKSSRGFADFTERLQLLDDLLDLGSGTAGAPSESDEPSDESQGEEKHVARAWRKLADISSRLAGGVADLACAASAVDVTMLLAASTGGHGDLNMIFKEAIFHKGAGSLVAKLHKLGSLDAALALCDVMDLSVPTAKDKAGLLPKKSKDVQAPRAKTWNRQLVDQWILALERVNQEGGPADFCQVCSKLGPLGDLKDLGCQVPRLRSLLGGEDGGQAELASLCKKIEECANVSGFLWQLRGCSVDKLQQHAFALDVLKKTFNDSEGGEEIWSLVEDKHLLERFFASIAQAGGVKAFVDAVADINMKHFVRNMATIKTMEMDMLDADDGAQTTSTPQALLDRVRSAGGMSSFLRATENLDMSKLAEYYRLLALCGICGKGDKATQDENLSLWTSVARRFRQEDKGCDIFLQICGTSKQSPEAMSLRAVRRCLVILRQLGLLPPGGQTKKLEWLASLLKDVNLAELLELASTVGGLPCFRESITLLQAFQLGVSDEAEAHRLLEFWMELVVEVQQARGIEAFLGHLRALRKLTSLCRYCKNASIVPITKGASPPAPPQMYHQDTHSQGVHLPSISDDESEISEASIPVRRQGHGSPSSKRYSPKSLPDVGSPPGVVRTASMPLLRRRDDSRSPSSWR